MTHSTNTTVVLLGAEDTQAVHLPHIPANDNQTVICEHKPCRDNTSIAVVQDGQGFQTIIRLSGEMRKKLKLNRTQFVRVEAVEVIDPYYVRKAVAYRFTPGDGDGAVKIVKEGNRFRIRKRGIDDAVRPATPFYFTAKQNLLLPYRDDEKGLSELISISSDSGWWKRREFLAGNDNGRQTTPAGDQCYTPRFILDLVLQADCVRAFDLDVCSMSPDGEYLPGNIDPESIEVLGWGSTPERFREKALVLGGVPATRYMTNEGAFGSLSREWRGELIWCNPPYSLRLWATFLEKAHQEVESGRAGIVVALVPADNTGQHVKYMFAPHAYRFELTAQLPFFKKRVERKDNVVKENVIDVIRGNQFVVLGKGERVQAFLRRFIDALLEAGYIAPQQAERYRSDYCRTHSLVA